MVIAPSMHSGLNEEAYNEILKALGLEHKTEPKGPIESLMPPSYKSLIDSYLQFK